MDYENNEQNLISTIEDGFQKLMERMYTLLDDIKSLRKDISHIYNKPSKDNDNAGE